jgi:Leucine-rich repeat (LRR) protein
MPSIIFKGIDIKNRERTIEVTDVNRIDLTKLGLQSIDLSPLSNWEFSKQVEILLLRENFLTEIDLSPLSNCPNLQNLALDKNQLSTIDLSPLANCKRLYKLYLYHNNLSVVDLSPLTPLNELAVLFLHGNPLTQIDLNPLPSSINRVGINQHHNLINIERFLDKLTIETDPRPQITYPENHEQNTEDIGYYDDYGDDFGFQDDYGRSPNDQRSDVMNPNNPEHQATLDNRANQLNPKHPAYRSSRGKR